jgi:hypothetical protein
VQGLGSGATRERGENGPASAELSWLGSGRARSCTTLLGRGCAGRLP